MIIDTHCHLSYPDFNNDRDAMLKRAAEKNVRGFVTIATGPEDWRRCLDLAEGRPAVRVSLGIHPNEAQVFSAATFDEMKTLAMNERVVAIGETGLDFYRDNAPREKQFEAFAAQLELASALNKPFVLHCRSAEAEMLGVLEDHKKKSNAPLRGVWHCFTSTTEFAKRAAALDLYFGLGGIVTYPKATELREAVATLSADRILLETDCPFLPPQGWRGQRNEPAYLTKVVQTLSEVRGVSPGDVETITTANAKRLFGDWIS